LHASAQLLQRSVPVLASPLLLPNPPRSLEPITRNQTNLLSFVSKKIY
jgi:hypothetical protein